MKAPGFQLPRWQPLRERSQQQELTALRFFPAIMARRERAHRRKFGGYGRRLRAFSRRSIWFRGTLSLFTMRFCAIPRSIARELNGWMISPAVYGESTPSRISNNGPHPAFRWNG